MSTYNKWVRIIHHWLVIPFTTAIIILLIDTVQEGAGYVSPRTGYTSCPAPD